MSSKTLEYTCAGPQPSDAPTLVLLHEGLGCTRLWRDVPTAISNATGFGVFAYSRAGYGHSDEVDLPRPLDYMTREAIDVLPLVLDSIGVRNTVLLGHSDGATIAAIHAGCVSDTRLMGVVLIAPHFFTEAAGLVEISKAREAFEDGDLRARLAKYHQNPDNAFRGWNDSWLNPEFKAWNVSNVLDNVRIPVLAIQGREDPYGTLAQIDAVSNRVTNAPVTKLIIDGCQHAPHLEHGPTVINAIAEFCRGLTPQRISRKNACISMSDTKLPSHAYLPGQNQRHAEDAFDAIRRTAEQHLDASQLAQSKAFLTGLVYLKEGFFWEAHEVLEPVWMVLPNGSIERQFVQGLIQLANGCLKLRMGRPKAALRLVGQTRALLPADQALTIMTLNLQEVHRWVDKLEADVYLVL